MLEHIALECRAKVIREGIYISGLKARVFRPSPLPISIIMGSVNDRNTTLLDEYCIGNYGQHLNDTELGGTYDILEYGGKEDGNHTVIEFKRKMNTDDKFDKAFSPGENISIIWAMADSKESDMKHNLANFLGQICRFHKLSSIERLTL